MKTYTTRDFRKNFRTVADLVESGETVLITRYGRPAFCIVPETQEGNELMRRLAGKKLVQKLQDANPNPAASALTQEDINKKICGLSP